MFEGLATEIDRVSIPPCGEAITEVLALRDRLEAKISEAVADFDRAGLWDLDSATSLTAWLRHHGAMTRREAGRVSGRAKKLRSLQVTDTARAMGHWAAHAAALADGPEPESKRGLHLSQMLDGTWVLDGALDPDAGQVISTALGMAESPDSDAEPPRSPGQRRHDSLAGICPYYLDHQHHRPAGRHRPHLNVVVDLDDLRAGAGGRVVDGAGAEGGGAAAPHL